MKVVEEDRIRAYPLFASKVHVPRQVPDINKVSILLDDFNTDNGHEILLADPLE